MRDCASYQAILSGDVHVWRVTLAPPDHMVARLAEALSEDELARAAKFRFENRRREFIVRRAALRHMLASYVRRSPEELQFEVSDYGKPRLLDPNGLEFNLSHSGDVAICAVAHVPRLGVDIELLRPFDDVLEIAQRFFAPGEVKTLAERPEEERARAFLACWTRKEAYIKARGLGLSLDLRLFCVSAPPDPPVLLYSDEPLIERANWALMDLPLGDRHVGCLALDRPGRAVVLRDWVL